VLRKTGHFTCYEQAARTELRLRESLIAVPDGAQEPHIMGSKKLPRLQKNRSGILLQGPRSQWSYALILAKREGESFSGAKLAARTQPQPLLERPSISL
jgi:hypothetical protein